MKNNLKTDVPQFTKKFPITSIDDFTKLEESITDLNEKEYIVSVRALCGLRGVKKGLCDLVTPEVLDHYNLDGTHNKMCLGNFKKFLHILFGGTYVEGATEKSFKSDIREGLKLAKNRYCKERKKKPNPPTEKQNVETIEKDIVDNEK